MNVTVIHDLSRLLAHSITACCGQLRFDQGVTRFFGLSRSATDETYTPYNIKYIFFLLYTNKSFEIITTALLNNRLQS